MCGFLSAGASLVAEPGFWVLGLQYLRLVDSGALLSSCVSGLNFFQACGIFLNQGSNQCPLPWQADS